MIIIRKKVLVLVISYLSAAVLALGGYSLAAYYNGGYADTAKYGYRHAFDEAVTAISDLDSTLRKAEYATGNAMTESVCTQAYGDCLAAEAAMSALPFSTQELEQTSGFLGRTGDYAAFLGRTAPENGGFSKEERENLTALAQTASQFASRLSQLQSDVDSGNVLMDDPENLVLTRTAGYKNSPRLSGTMHQLESAFPEQAQLEYDGKYSYRTVPEQGEMVTEAAAKKAAAEFLGLDEERLKLEYVSQGNELFYYFSASSGGGADIAVTGDGKIRSVTSSRTVSACKLTQQEAEQTAEKFLRERGYGNLKLTSSQKTGGITACQFAPLSGKAVCYPDLIKISIACDNGGLYSFDAADYIRNHKERTPPTNIISMEQAKKALPEGITVDESGLAIYLSAGKNEVYCYEFKCTGFSGERVTIFVNAVTGAQQDIALG